MREIKTPGIRFIATSVCNYNCTYCHNEWEPKEREITQTDKEIIRELIIASKNLGGKEVDITGGEPLLRIEKVETILKIATSLDLWTNLTTNGYFLSQYKDKLIQAGLKEIHVHIPSLDETKYWKLMGKTANLKRVLSALEETKGKFPLMKINIPIIYGINENEIPEMIQYFNSRSITPRFIESMSTSSFNAPGQRVFENVIKKSVRNLKLKSSYLWGINEYESEYGNFETLRCICFDRKCDICPENNFIHIDQNYKIRPCNLRQFKIQAEKGNCSEKLKNALDFLSKQTGIPEEYKKLWGKEYKPLRIVN